MTKYDPRKNAEGYNDPTPYAAEKHMMAQIRGKQARVAGGYFENIISASCDYYLSRGLAKIEKTPEPMKPLGAKNRKGQFLACYTKQAQPDYGGTLKGGRSIYFEAKHTDDERIEQQRISGSVRSIVLSPLQQHSRKPAEIRDRIVELMGDLPRIELFAREAAPGWDVWGNEAPTPEVKDAPADSVELAGKEETHEPDDQRDPAPQL